MNQTYKQDVIMNCGIDALYNDGCSYPANGIKLQESDAMFVVACPMQFPLGTKLEIEGYGWVTCVDRGGSIKGSKIDLWAGYGDAGLFRIETQKRPAGEIEIINTDFTNIGK